MIQNKSEVARDICKLIGHDDILNTSKVTMKFLLDVRDAIEKAKTQEQIRSEILMGLKDEIRTLLKKEIRDAVEQAVK